MAQVAANAVYSKPKAGGAVWSAPIGTAIPTDAASPLPEAFKAWGYVSDAGIVENNSPTTNAIKAYGGSTVLVIEGGNEVSYTLTPLEYRNAHVQAEIYGDSHVEANDSGKATKVEITDDPHKHRVFVFEHILSDGCIERDVLPDAMVSSYASNTYSSTAPLGPQVTVTPFPDESNIKVYKHFAEAE